MTLSTRGLYNFSYFWWHLRQIFSFGIGIFIDKPLGGKMVVAAIPKIAFKVLICPLLSFNKFI